MIRNSMTRKTVPYLESRSSERIETEKGLLKKTGDQILLFGRILTEIGKIMNQL